MLNDCENENQHEIKSNIGGWCWWKRRNKLEKRLIGIVVVTMTIAIVSTAVAIAKCLPKYRIFKESMAQIQGELICDTVVCNEIAETMLSNMDLSVHPCDNFYQFACGGWENRKKSEHNVSTVLISSQMDEEIDWTIKEMLTSQWKPKDNNLDFSLDMLRTYYHSCNHFGSIPAKRLMSHLGHMYKANQTLPQSLNLTLTMVKLLRIGETPFFDVRVQIDSRNSSRLIIAITSPTRQTLPDLSINNTTDKDDIELVDHTLQVILDYLGEQSIKNELKMFATELQKITPPAKDLKVNTADVDVIMSVQNLQQIFPWIDWKMLFNHLFHRQFDDQNEVQVWFPKFLKQLNELLENFSPREIYNVVLAFFIKDNLFNFVKTQQNYRPSWEYCVNEAKSMLPHVMASVYMYNVSQEFLKTIYNDTIEIFEKLKLGLKNQIQQSQWLSDDAKRAAIEKVDKMKGDFGKVHNTLDDPIIKKLETIKLNTTDFFTNTIKLQRINREIHRELYVQKLEKNEIEKYFSIDIPYATNAYYVYYFNKMAVSLGMLQSPYYTFEAPNYFTYGSLGSVIAHEMFHAFDTIGFKYDSDGNLNNWTNSMDVNHIDNITTCFKKWYADNFVIQFNYNSNTIEVTLDGGYTLNENIADSSIKLTYNAYKTWANSHPTEPLIPGTTLNRDQIFFLSAAQTSCASLSVADYIRYLTSSTHPPDPERVNGKLMNSVEFSTVYQCPSSSRMNPTFKCQFW
ncbi:hypothetical protein CHUAL_001332 [Chamberlinius hualienensis]